MAKSLDELIEFLLGEIALSGLSGLTIDGLAKAVSSFYDPTHLLDANDATAEDLFKSESRVNVDRLLLGKIWTWLGRHPDISLGDNKEYNNIPLDQIDVELARDAVNENLNPVDQSQNLGSPPEHSRQPESLGVDQKKRVPSEAPRIRANEDRIYQALCGHPPDVTKVASLEFDLLAQIAATRSDGMLQGELIRLTGQDKRSVPKRTDALQHKGYIIKEVVFLKGNRTSRLTLKKFAPSKAYDPDDIHRQGGQPLKGSTVRDAVRRIFDVLSQQHLVSQTQLAQQLNLESAAESTVLGRILRRLDRLKCLKRVKTAIGPSATSGDVQPFVQLLHRPSPEDLQNFEVNGLKLDYTIQHLSSVLEPGSSDELGGRLSVSEAPGTAPQLARWNPDRNMANTLLDAARIAGHAGLTNTSSRQMVTGLFVRRTIESLLARISAQSLSVQPLHLRHLTIVRTSITVDGVAQFTHYSWDIFLQLVAEHAIDVSGIPGAKQALAMANAKKDAASNEKTAKVIKIDAYGFPIQNALSLQVKNGECNFSTLIRAAGPGDVLAKVGEPILVKDPGQRPIVTLREILPEETRVKKSSLLTKPAGLGSPQARTTATPTKKNVNEAVAGGIVRGRPRKYARGTESFWRRIFLEARTNAGMSKKDHKGVMKDPAGLALYARRPPGFDDTLSRGIDAGLPVPHHIEDINEAWVASTKSVLDRSSAGLYITPKGVHHSKIKSQSQILIFKSSRLQEVSFRNRNVPHKCRFISSSIAHSFTYPLLPSSFSEREDLRRVSKARILAKEKSDRSKQQSREQEVSAAEVLHTDEESAATPPSYALLTTSQAASHEASIVSTNEELVQPGYKSNPTCASPAVLPELETESQDIKLPSGKRPPPPPPPPLKYAPVRSGEIDNSHIAAGLSEQVSDSGSRPSSGVPVYPQTGGMLVPRSNDANQLFLQTDLSPSDGENAFESNSPVDALVNEGERILKNVLAVATTSAERSADTPLQDHIEQSVPEDSGKASALSVNSHISAETTPTLALARHESWPPSEVDGEFVPSGAATPRRRKRTTQKRHREETASDSDEFPSQTQTQGSSREALKVGALCRKIVFQLVSETSGVAPNDASTLRRISTARWQEAGQPDRPILKTLKAAIKSLCERGKLRQVMFSHRSRTGMMLKRAILFLPSISPDSQVVQDMKQKIIDAEPADYIPPHWRDEGNRKPLIGKTAFNVASDEEETPRKRRRVSSVVDDAASPSMETRASKRRRSSSTATLIPVDERTTLERSVSEDASDLGPIRTVGVPTAATGFLTLKVPRLGSLPTVQIDRWIIDNPVVALRSDSNPSNPWKDTSTNGGRSVRKPRARLNAKKVIWANDGKLDFPSSLQDILQMPGLNVHFKDVQSADIGLQRFASEVEAVRAWEEQESKFSSRTKYAFINHGVPKALYARALVPAAISFETLVQFSNKDQVEVEVPLPPTESWPNFVSALEAPTESLQRIAWLPSDHSPTQPPSAPQEEIAAFRSKRPYKRKPSTEDIDFEPEIEPQPKRQRGGARGLQVTSSKRGNARGRVSRTERPARGTQHLRNMAEHDIYRIVIAVIVVRTLAGGLDSYIDWPLVMKLFPDRTQDFVADRWKTLSKKYPRDINSLTNNLQWKYLEALEADEVPSVNFEDLASTDWAGIIDWALKKLDNLNSEQIGELPDTRDEFDKTTKLSFTEPKRYHNLLGYNLNITNPAREDLISSLIFGHTHPASISTDNALSVKKRMQMQYTPRFESEMSDPTFHLAKSWALSTVLTPQESFDPSVALAKLSRLAPTAAKRDTLLARVLKLLQDEKIIQRVSKDRNGHDTVSSVRSWEPARKLFERFDERRMITPSMLRRAAAYKLDVLDAAFARGESAAAVVFESDQIVDDAQMVAVLNLYSQGVVRFRPGRDVPRTRYGLEHEKVGYQTRSMDKRVLSFAVDIYTTSPTSWVSGDPAAAGRQLRVPRRGGHVDDEEQDCLIPAWVDINGHVQVHLWEMFVGGVVGLLAQMPGATAAEISRAIGFALDMHEVELLMGWCVQAGFAKVHMHSGGYETTEWWWLCLSKGAEGGWTWTV